MRAQRRSAEIRDQGGAARAADRAAEHPDRIKIDAPDLLHAPLTAKAEVRLNGSVVMINGVTGTLGDGAFNGWASVDLSSKPLVKLDLDFQKLAVATSRGTRRVRRRSPGAMRRSTSTASTMSTRRRAFPRPNSTSATARFAPAAIDATLASGVLKAQVSNLGAYDGNANGDLTIDASTANPTYAMRADLTGVRALPLLQQPRRFRQARRQDAGEDQRALLRHQPARDHVEHGRHRLRRVPGRRHQGASTSRR